MIRRNKTTIFTDAKENTAVLDVKRMIEGIVKIAPENMRLFREDTVSVILTFFLIATVIKGVDIH